MRAVRSVITDERVRTKRWNACALFVSFLITFFNLIALVRAPARGASAQTLRCPTWLGYISPDLAALLCDSGADQPII